MQRGSGVFSFVILSDMIVSMSVANERSAGKLIERLPTPSANFGQPIVFLHYGVEYDLMGPMDIRPAPTETARVGLVLTELLD